jgi:elongation factor P
MRLVAGRDLKRGALDRDEAARGEPGPQRVHDAVAPQEEGPPALVLVAAPPGAALAGCRLHGAFLQTQNLSVTRPKSPFRARSRQTYSQGHHVTRVIASSVRKGNILEVEGRLYAVLSAESFFPGKGTPTTQIDMRRLSDGVKTSHRYKTTEQVERAFVEDREFSFLYQDGENFVFMNPENYEQLTVMADVVGDYAPYLQEGMVCQLSIFEENAVGIQLPARIVLEVVETEPAIKNQTASSSYKPGKLENGMRIMVPPHVEAGIKVVVATEDGSYVERFKG